MTTCGAESIFSGLAHKTSIAPKAVNTTDATRCTGTWNSSEPAAEEVEGDAGEDVADPATEVNELASDVSELNKLEPSDASEDVMLAAVDVAPDNTELIVELADEASELREVVGGSTPEMSEEMDEATELSESVLSESDAVVVSPACLSTRAGSGAASATRM